MARPRSHAGRTAGGAAMVVGTVAVLVWLAAGGSPIPGPAPSGSAPVADVTTGPSTSALPPPSTPSPTPSPTRSPTEVPSPTGEPSPAPSVDGGPGASPTASPLPTPGCLTASPQARAALDRALTRQGERLGLPGASAAVRFPDGSTWVGVYGLADIAANRPVEPGTPFAAASISKTFTAALVLILADEGRLGLDVPVRTYLPDLDLDRRITVRMLLDHTSGLRDFFFAAGIDKALLAKPAKRWTAADSLRYVGKPRFPPGTGFAYSNTNYLLLGLIAEAVGGASAATQIRERFLDPLDLHDTTFQGAEAPTMAPAHAYRFTGTAVDLPAIDLADGSDISPFTSVVTASGAAGSIASSARDLVRWSAALYAGDVLSAASRRAMVGAVAETAPYGPRVGYGLGVQAVTVDGRPTLGHSGRMLGARSVVRWLPVESMGIAVLTNQSRSDPNAIARILLRAALAPRDDCPATPGR